MRHSVFGCRLSSTPSIQYSLRLISARGDAAALLLPALPVFGAKPRDEPGTDEEQQEILHTRDRMPLVKQQRTRTAGTRTPTRPGG